MKTRTDEEIGWELARQHGITSDREYEAFKGTAAYQMAILNERINDLGRALVGPILRILSQTNRRDP